MYTEDIIEEELEKLKNLGVISFPKSFKDFKDIRSEDSTQNIPPHLCYRFTTPEIDEINSKYPQEFKKVIGKFRFRYLCLFELYTYNTHEIQAHPGFTLDLTFPIPEEPDELTSIRDKAWKEINEVFVDRPWARPYSGANWHHLNIAEISEDTLNQDPRGYEVALREFLSSSFNKAIELSKKLK